MSDPGDRTADVRRLIEKQPALSRSGDVRAMLRRVCAAATKALSASGVGITVITGAGERGVTAASDPVSEWIEELQFILGEGPCLEAYSARGPVLIADIDRDATNRWPAYAPAAYEAGLRAVFAFPLQNGAVRIGALDVYRHRVGALSADELAQALTFADVALTALLDRHQNATEDGAVDGLDGAIGRSAELFQAQGMVMVQLGVSLDEAMSVIRAYAYAEDRRLGDVARDVVARILRFDQDPR